MRTGVTVAAVLGVLLSAGAASSAAQASTDVSAARATSFAANSGAAVPLRRAAAGMAGSSRVTVTRAALAAAGPSKVAWGKCNDSDMVELKAKCGYLSVPLNYAKPKGKKIKIAVSLIKHTVSKKKYQGIMLANPGGPGGSGFGMSAMGRGMPKGAGVAYDWIGFDPRGVGSSRPALSCDSTYFGYNRPAYVPTTPELERAWLKRAKAYAKRCDKAGGALLDHVKTIDTVRDMDSIRKALGKKKINFYGYSYGTYLGQVYASKYPKRVGRMVLDSNVDPRGVWYQGNLDQDAPFDRNINIFFGWVAQNDAKFHLGATAAEVGKHYYKTLDELQTDPAGGLIGPAEWADIFVSAGYSVGSWPWTAKIFAKWVNEHDAAALQSAYGYSPEPGSDNSYAMYLAVQCTDASWPKDFSVWRRDNNAIHAKAPFMAWSNAWFNAPCMFWGAKAGKPVRVTGKKAPGILLIGETLDAATPFEGNLEVRSRFPRSVLVEGVGGTTHANSPSGVACLDDVIAAYLQKGKLPKRAKGRTSDVKCPVPALPKALTESAPAAPARRPLLDGWLGARF